MEEYNGRINVSKDTMLFVVNNIFNQDIKENTTKENILIMVDFIDTINNLEIKNNLQRLIQGKGAFRRFKDN